MRRAQAIIVIVAVLALPLAPLAWGMACESASVPMMCCLLHTTHSPSGKPMQCHCTGKSEKPATDVVLVAPIPPGAAEARIEMVSPQDARATFFVFSASTASGYSSILFEPPRV
jgi:hypothetical protein